MSRSVPSLTSKLRSYTAWLLAWIAIAAALLLLAANINRAQATEVELSPGRLKAEIELPSDGTSQASGSSIFVNIALKTRRRRDKARLDLTVTGGEIVQITGKRLDITGDGASRQVTANRLRRNRMRYIKAEILLGAPVATGTAQTDAGAAKNASHTAAASLRLTLHDRKSEDSEDLTVRWPLTYCARDYKLGLSVISNNIAKTMLTAQARLRTRDKSFPGHWLASSRRLGRPRLTGKEREVIRFLAEFVDRKGYAPEFGDNGRYRWLTYRVSNDLNNYITQPVYPALCTGADQLLAFHKSNMRGFKKRSTKVQTIVQQVKRLAKSRFETVVDGIRARKQAWLAQREAERQNAATRAAAAQAENAAAGETATVQSSTGANGASAFNSTSSQPDKISLRLQKPLQATSVTVAEPNRTIPDSYLGMIRELAVVALPPGRRFRIKVETRPLSALQAITNELRKVKPRRVSGRKKRNRPALSPTEGKQPGSWSDRKTFDATVAALRLIEAGIYADELHSRYQGINESVDKTIAAIAKTHERSCTCADE